MSKKKKIFLAVDLGASSGRVLAGEFDGKKLELNEIHRFPNGPNSLGSHLYWNVLTLWKEIQDGLKKASSLYGDAIQSVGVDTWGVDFVLLGPNDQLIGNPFHYRDSQNSGMIDRASKIVSREEIFAETGLQFMDFNSLYQLLAIKQNHGWMLDQAQAFLMMPDYFHFLLTGEKANEFTDATTSQFLNPATRNWSRALLKQFDLPTGMLQQIAHPGANLGKVSQAVVESTGLRNVDVILPGTHDTASAVMAVPAVGQPSDQPDWSYISSGTWSLMGAEISSPIISDRCREFNFTNEGGVGGTIRLLKNITGLWIVQECRRVWAETGQDFSWDQLTGFAKSATPLESFFDPDDPSFLAPTNMPAAIQSYCEKTEQPVPNSEGQIIRCALESMALKYRYVLEMQQELTRSTTSTIHIVGGGTQNRELCQMTADACDRAVVAGPIEATAIGNVMMQAIASGDVDSVESARRIIRASFPVEQYEPKARGGWDDAFVRFSQLIG